MYLKRIGLLVLVLVIVAVPVMAAEQGNNPAQEEAAEEAAETVAAVVNGDQITVGEVDQYIGMNNLLQQMVQMDQQFVQALFSTEAGQEFLNEYRRTKMLKEDGTPRKEVFAQKVIMEEAKKRDVLSDEEKEDVFQQQLQQLKEQNDMSEEELISALKQQGVIADKEDLKTIVLENVLVREMQEEITGDINVEEQEVSDYYNEKIDEYTHEDEVRASHILFEEEEKAEEVLAMVKSGAEFDELAQEYSTGPSGSEDGDVGFFDKDSDMYPAFKEAAFDLEKGEISDVVESEAGYHIIKVTDKREAGTTPLSEVEEEIKEELLQGKTEKAWNEFVEGLLDETQVEIKL